MDTIRILRLVEFEGPKEVVEYQLSRSLQGETRMPNGLAIRAVTVTEMPDTIRDEFFRDIPVVHGWPGQVHLEGEPV